MSYWILAHPTKTPHLVSRPGGNRVYRAWNKLLIRSINQPNLGLIVAWLIEGIAKNWLVVWLTWLLGLALNAALPRTVAHTALYAEAVRQVVDENPEVVLIDLWKAVMDKAAPLHVNAHWLPGSPEGGFNRLFTDGLHLNGEAYRLFYDLVTPHIPEGESSQYIYPDWRDLAS